MDNLKDVLGVTLNYLNFIYSDKIGTLDVDLRVIYVFS